MLVTEPERKRPIRRARRRWEDDMKLILEEWNYLVRTENIRLNMGTNGRLL
jgi:hypothetical protein